MAKTTPKAGLYAYISNSASSSVTVMDVETKTPVVNTIRVGGNPGALALTKDQKFLYVGNANSGSHSVSVIEVGSWKVDKVDVGQYLPTYLVASKDARTLYVGLQEYPIPPDKTLQMRSAVCAIDTATNKVKDVIDLSFGGPAVDGWPSLDGGCGAVGELAINPNSNLLYVQVSNANKIAVIDTTTNRVIKTFQAGSGPWLSFAPNGLHYYEVNTYNLGGGVRVFKADDSVEQENISPGRGCRTPESMGVTPNSDRLYVSCVDSNNLSVIDATDYKDLATVQLPFQPGPVGITPDGSEVWAVGGGDQAVLYVIPTATNQLPAEPIRLPDGGPSRVVFGRSR